MAAIRQVSSNVFVFIMVLAVVVPCDSSLTISCNATEAAVAVRNATECGKLIMAHVVLSPGRYALLNSSANSSASSEDIFSERFERITRAGMQDLFHLGEWLRERYASILPLGYVPDDVLVRSEGSDKALESVECVLATFFPPGRNNFTVGDNWQPVPIHTLPQNMSQTLGGRLCERYEYLLGKLMNSPEMEDVNTENSDLYKALSNMTGRKIASIGQLARLYDILEAEISMNATLPKWASKCLLDILSKFSVLNYRIPTFTKKMNRLKSGPFLRELGLHMRNKVNGSLEPNRSLFIYSVNEATLASLLDSLGAFNCLPPPKSATITIDLWASADNVFYVTVSYKNETASEPYILKLPACPHVCPLLTFLDVMAEYVPRDWSNECKSPKRDYDLLILASLCGFFALLVIILVISLVRLWFIRNDGYSGLK